MPVTKTIQTPLIAWQDIAAGVVVLGTPLDITTILAGALGLRLGRRSSTGFSVGYPQIRFEISFQDTGDRRWTPLGIYVPLVGASLANSSLNGAVSAAATSFVVSSATNIAIGDLLFLGDPTPSNYELVRVKGVSGTTITPEEPVANAHATGAIVHDQAEMYAETKDLSPYRSLRVVVDNIGSSQNISVEVQLTTLDSV